MLNAVSPSLPNDRDGPFGLQTICLHTRPIFLPDVIEIQINRKPSRKQAAHRMPACLPIDPARRGRPAPRSAPRIPPRVPKPPDGTDALDPGQGHSGITARILTVWCSTRSLRRRHAPEAAQVAVRRRKTRQPRSVPGTATAWRIRAAPCARCADRALIRFASPSTPRSAPAWRIDSAAVASRSSAVPRSRLRARTGATHARPDEPPRPTAGLQRGTAPNDVLRRGRPDGRRAAVLGHGTGRALYPTLTVVRHIRAPTASGWSVDQGVSEGHRGSAAQAHRYMELPDSIA